MSDVVYVARCPEHGLHGCRQECFECGGPVEQVPMVPLTAVGEVAAGVLGKHRLGFDKGGHTCTCHEWRPVTVRDGRDSNGVHMRERHDGHVAEVLSAAVGARNG